MSALCWTVARFIFFLLLAALLSYQLCWVKDDSSYGWGVVSGLVTVELVRVYFRDLRRSQREEE